MTDKSDYIAAAESVIAEYPTLAQFYNAKDPRVLGMVNAMASMFAMHNKEIQVWAAEPFTKARDVTVLADAAVKGILPFATKKNVKLKITNVNASPFTVSSGRILLDNRGRQYTVNIGETIGANTFGYVFAYQEFIRDNNVNDYSFLHEVTESIPFYSIQIPKSTVGDYISKIRIFSLDFGEAPVEFFYTADFLNVDEGDHIFHLETDENQDLYIRFGAVNIAGYQPSPGEQFRVAVYECSGNFDIALGSAFTFNTSVDVNEIGARIELVEIEDSGSDPMDISTMREVTKYPSIYDSSAVFLGNFDFLIRRNISPFEFLSVWNEHTEEGVRGESLDNINTIFVAAQKDGVVQATLETQIEDLIIAADDTYKVTFVDIIEEEINCIIDADISKIYDPAEVESQIRTIMLANYGSDTAFAKRGFSKIRYRDVYKILTDGIQAFQGDQAGDFRLTVTYTGNDTGDSKVCAYSRTGDTVTITFVAHNYMAGDLITAVDGNDPTIEGSYKIATVLDDSFTYRVTGATGALTGSVGISSLPRPEKWRYVSSESLTVNINE